MLKKIFKNKYEQYCEMNNEDLDKVAGDYNIDRPEKNLFNYNSLKDLDRENILKQLKPICDSGHNNLMLIITFITLIFSIFLGLSSIIFSGLNYLSFKGQNKMLENQIEMARDQLRLNEEQFDLNNRPYIFVDSFKIDTNEKGSNFINIKLKNSGTIPGTVTVGEFCVQYDIDNNICAPDLNFKSDIKNMYYVAPGDTDNSIVFITPLDLRALKNSIVKLRLNYKPSYIKDDNIFHFDGLLRVDWSADSYLVIRADGN